MGQSTQECKHLTLELSLVNILHHYLLTLQYNKRQTIRPDVCAFMSVFGLNFKLPDSPLLACLQVKTYFTWEICLSYTHAHTHTHQLLMWYLKHCHRDTPSITYIQAA